MKEIVSAEKENKMLTPFLIIAFGLTWGLAAVLIFAYDQVVAIFGEISMSNPVFILAVYAPLIASTIMVISTYGIKNLGRFFRRATYINTSIWWWVFILLGVPAAMYAGAAIKGNAGAPFPFTPWYLVFPALLQMLLLGPLEEFGWCGIVLPILQRKYSPFITGLIHGVIWMVWHIPAFLIGGTPQSAWAFLPFACGGIACSMIFTAAFNDSRGSILIPALLHFQMNNPIWPDAQPWDNLVLLIFAIFVLILKRNTMFKPGTGVTDILSPDVKTNPGQRERVNTPRMEQQTN